MPLRSLVVIALRLYAIYWLIQGSTGLLASVPFWFQINQVIGGYMVPLETSIFSAAMILIFVVLWALADRISVLVTKDHDMPLSSGSLTKEHLYQFAFVFLGLYFFLSSLVSLVETGYRFFEYDFALADSDPHKGAELAPFLGHVFTAIAGLICILGAAKWTRKLAKSDPT